MPRRFGHPFRRYPTPHHTPLNRDWSRDDYLRAQQAALSRDFDPFSMDASDDGQVARRHEQPDYTKKDFKRAAEDLHSCLQEALELFTRFEADFNSETREIKDYAGEELLDIIFERKVQRFENGPRATASNTKSSGRTDQPYNENYGEQPSNNAPGIMVLQRKIQQTVESMFNCKSPEPIENDDGLQIRVEEVQDFEDRMRRTASRLYLNLGRIFFSVQAFRGVIRDLRTMSQDLNLFPLNLWKADGGEAEYQGDGR
jgi:hypothetical protein